jgi:phosphate starvation-inducible protein PhoH
MILCGDNAQNDMKGKLTGLAYLSQLVNKYNIPEVTFVEFTKANIVRSGITKAFVEAFEEEFFAEQANKPTIYKSKKG